MPRDCVSGYWVRFDIRKFYNFLMKLVTNCTPSPCSPRAYHPASHPQPARAPCPAAVLGVIHDFNEVPLPNFNPPTPLIEPLCTTAHPRRRGACTATALLAHGGGANLFF